MPNIAFLGVCDRASYTRQGPFLVQNIIGLRLHVVSYIYPLNFAGWKVAFAFYDPANIKVPTELKVVGPEGDIAFTLTLRIENVEPKAMGEAGNAPPSQANGPFLVRKDERFWIPLTTGVAPPALIPRPGPYRILLADGEQIGLLDFHLVEPPPLTEDRKSAIRSDPRASKVIEMRFECTECMDRLRSYVAMERVPEREREGIAWYSDLPESFVCKCGKARIDLGIVRRNLHGLLGIRHGEATNLSILPMYERSTLDTVIVEFSELLNTKCSEEEIQQYISEHPVLLAPFHPHRVFFKSPILSKFKTDITVLTQTGVLLLIELERSDKKLLTKAGDTTAHLQHALRQVRDWIHEVNDHRQATIDCLGLEKSDVVAVETMVIMGRDGAHDLKSLLRLKGVDHGRQVKVWTYDDLLRAFDAVVRSIGTV